MKDYRKQVTMTARRWVDKTLNVNLIEAKLTIAREHGRAIKVVTEDVNTAITKLQERYAFGEE